MTSCGDDSVNVHNQDIPTREPVTVMTQVAGTQTSDAPDIFSGKIQAKDKATVSARMMGYVTGLNVEVGDRVSVGQTILTIKNDELPAKRGQIDASINEAKAALQNVKVNYDRMKILWEQQSITRKDWDDISAQYDMMKAKVEGANAMRTEIDEVIAYTRVSAPISGVVTAKMINSGDLVNPGVPLMTIESNRGYEVATYVSDGQIAQIKKGMSIDVEIKPLGKTVKAVVGEISPSSINSGGQFGVIADLKLNAEEVKNVFPGMYANVFMNLPKSTTQSAESKLMVPKSALVERGQLIGLYTVSNQGTAMLRWVRTGKATRDEIEIVSGLIAGEEYITSNIDQLVDGIPVRK